MIAVSQTKKRKILFNSSIEVRCGEMTCIEEIGDGIVSEDADEQPTTVLEYSSFTVPRRKIFPDLEFCPSVLVEQELADAAARVKAEIMRRMVIEICSTPSKTNESITMLIPD